MQYTITYYRLRNNELAVNLRMITCYKTIEINFHASATFLTLFIVNADQQKCYIMMKYDDQIAVNCTKSRENTAEIQRKFFASLK